MRAFRAALLELQLCQLPETNWGTSALRMIPRGRAVSICNQHHCRPWIHHGVQHWPTHSTQTNGKWSRKLQRLMAQGARSDSRSLFAAHNSASGEKLSSEQWEKEKNWKTQVTGFHVWSVLNLGLYIQKDLSTLITDHVSFSSCYVLLLQKKPARFYDLVTSRAFHQDAILTHTAALALQAPDISTIRNISVTITIIGQKLTQVPLVPAIKRSTHFHMFEKVDSIAR